MIELKSINKIVNNSSSEKIKILNNISLKFADTGLYILSGKSGSGKTSILNILCGISNPTDGEFYYNNELIDFKQSSSLSKIYDDSSFVFQNALFVSKLSVIENIQIIGLNDIEEIDKILNYVDLYKCKDTNVSLLSGGEKQRLSIAIALIKGSKYIVLDEPTASLDYDNKMKIMDLLKEISKDKLVIMASHDQEIINKYADYIYEIENGEITNFINVIDDILTINILKDNKDYLLKIYEKLKIHNISYVIINDEKKEIDRDNLLLSLMKIFDNYESSEIKVEFKKEIIENDSTIKIDCNTKPNFSFKLQLKYACSFIKSKIFKSILLVLLFTLSFLLLSFQININMIKSYNVNYNNFNKNDTEYMTIYKNEFNNNLKEDLKIFNGKDLKNELFDNNIQFIQYNSMSISNFDVKLFVLDSNIKFKDNDINVLDKDEIIVSKTLFSKINENYCYIENIKFENIEFNYFDKIVDYDLINSYSFNKSLKPEEEDRLMNEILIGFISKSYYLELMKTNKTIYEKMPSSKKNCDDFDLYSKKLIEYDFESYNSLKDNEIIISTRLLSYLGIDNSIVGQEVYNINLRTSKNYKRYIDDINLYDIYDELIVKDVIDDTNMIVYGSNDYFEKYLNESIDYLRLSVNVSKYNDIKKLNKLGYDFDSILVNNSNAFIKLVNAQFKPILLSFTIILITISLLLVLLFSNTNFNNNIHEVCLMKAYGIRTRRIVNSFLIYNIIIMLASFIISFVLYLISINLINYYLMKPNVININFNIIDYNFTYILLLICIIAVITIVSTLIPLYKIKKYDLYNLIKE